MVTSYHTAQCSLDTDRTLNTFFRKKYSKCKAMLKIEQTTITRELMGLVLYLIIGIPVSCIIFRHLSVNDLSSTTKFFRALFT